MDAKLALRNYRAQKSHAKERGIGWELTFKQWCDWWGDDIHKRGVGHDKLQMQRFHDKGPYTLGNIQKGYPRQNRRTAANCKRNATAAASAKNLQAEIDAGDVSVKEHPWFDEDEWEIAGLTYGRGQRKASFLR